MKLPQVSLRELFLLVVIAALGCGWWVDRSRLTNKLEWDKLIQTSIHVSRKRDR